MTTPTSSTSARTPLSTFRSSSSSYALPTVRNLTLGERVITDKSDATAEVLYVHPTVKVYTFRPPENALQQSNTEKKLPDADYPIDAIEVLPWRSRTESCVAIGQLVIEKVRGSAHFLKCDKLVCSMLRNSQIWCVDGESKFVMRVGKLKYNRIEMPNDTIEDGQRIQEFKDVVSGILKFEKTPCPFIRAFSVELPDDAITPRRKGQWKARQSLPGSLDEDESDTKRTRLIRSSTTRALPPSAFPSRSFSAFEIERPRTANTALSSSRFGSIDMWARSSGNSIDGRSDTESRDSETERPDSSEPSMMDVDENDIVEKSTIRSPFQRTRSASTHSNTPVRSLRDRIERQLSSTYDFSPVEKNITNHDDVENSTKQSVNITDGTTEERSQYKSESKGENSQPEDHPDRTVSVPSIRPQAIIDDFVQSYEAADHGELITRPYLADLEVHKRDESSITASEGPDSPKSSLFEQLLEDVRSPVIGPVGGCNFDTTSTSQDAVANLSSTQPDITQSDTHTPQIRHKHTTSDMTIRPNTPPPQLTPLVLSPKITSTALPLSTPSDENGLERIQTQDTTYSWLDVSTPGGFDSSSPSKADYNQFLPQRRTLSPPGTSFKSVSRSTNTLPPTVQTMRRVITHIVTRPVESVVLVFAVLFRIACGATVEDIRSGQLFRSPTSTHQAVTINSSQYLQVNKAGSTRESVSDEDDFGVPLTLSQSSSKRAKASGVEEQDQVTQRNATTNREI